MRKAITRVAGVFSVQVDLGEKRATVRFDEGKTGADQLIAALDDAGYDARPLG